MKRKTLIIVGIAVLVLVVIVLTNGDAAKEGFNAGVNGN